MPTQTHPGPTAGCVDACEEDPVDDRHPRHPLTRPGFQQKEDGMPANFLNMCWGAGGNAVEFQNCVFGTDKGGCRRNCLLTVPGWLGAYNHEHRLAPKWLPMTWTHLFFKHKGTMVIHKEGECRRV